MATTGEIAAEDLLEQRRELALAAVRRLQELCRPLNEALRSVHPRPQLDAVGDGYARNVLHTPRSWGRPDVVFTYDRVSKIGSGEQPRRFEFSFGRGLELTADGTLIFRAFVLVGLNRTLGSKYSWTSEALEAPVGSVESERMLEEGVAVRCPRWGSWLIGQGSLVVGDWTRRDENGERLVGTARLLVLAATRRGRWPAGSGTSW